MHPLSALCSFMHRTILNCRELSIDAWFGLHHYFYQSYLQLHDDIIVNVWGKEYPRYVDHDHIPPFMRVNFWCDN